MITSLINTLRVKNVAKLLECAQSGNQMVQNLIGKGGYDLSFLMFQFNSEIRKFYQTLGASFLRSSTGQGLEKKDHSVWEHVMREKKAPKVLSEPY